MPNNNTITQAHVDRQIVDIQVQTVYEKVTVVSVRLRNGFVLVESAGAVDKANYSEALGAEICLQRIKNKIWEIEGYRLSSELAARRCTLCGGEHRAGEPWELVGSDSWAHSACLDHRGR